MHTLYIASLWSHCPRVTITLGVFSQAENTFNRALKPLNTLLCKIPKAFT